MNAQLDGKIAIVTGAGQGIGEAIARRFVEDGAKVVVSDVNAENAENVAASLPGSIAVKCDVSNEDEVAALVAAATSHFGSLNVMVNNAGIVMPAPVVATPFEDWRKVMGINLDGVFLGIKHAAPAIAAAGGGAIVNTASIKAYGGLPASASYSASKAAIVSLTKTAALELRHLNVRVNALCPGYINTEMVAGLADDFKEITGIDVGEYVTHIQGRLGEAHEIAAVAAFLASDRSRFINAAPIVVDGGAIASLL